MAALRRGKVENCVHCIGPSSFILPIAPEAVHEFPDGSQEAIERFETYLRRRPEDMGIRWLLDLAYMTLGRYPQSVPAEFYLPIEPAPAAPSPFHSITSSADLPRFENVAVRVGLAVRGPDMAGGAIYDDFTGDDRPDLFWTSFDPDLGASLFVNRGDGLFEDRSREANLSDQSLAVNCVQADFDNDGLLDIYLATGRPGYSALVPNAMLRNDRGRRFEDVTFSNGTGHLQKGHGVAFADFDGDGAEDHFVQLGGAVPDDRSFNALFHNPGHEIPWLKVLLIGTQSNRSAIGARIQLEFQRLDGSRRSIYRTISSGSSYGGNSLTQTIGLGDAEAIDALTIQWPTSGTEQVFRDVQPRQFLKIEERANTFQTIDQKPIPLPEQPDS